LRALSAQVASGVHPNPLVELLARCVVTIADGSGVFRGTGFFVAPGEVITCAHVIQGLDTVAVAWELTLTSAVAETILPALDVDDPASRFHPLPDIALLQLVSPPKGHPCVWLDSSEPATGPPADVLRISAFTIGEHAGGQLARSSATTEFEGPFDEGGSRALKLSAGRIIGGFSGAPLLNVRSGAVCGVVESSRGEHGEHGGFGVSVGGFIDQLPGLAERNADHHRTDRRWEHARHAERERAAERDGRRDRLPLREPFVTLAPGAAVPVSDLLRPRRAVVPLVGREVLLDELMLWRESEVCVSVAILSAAGGFGKTRLAAEVCSDAQAAGWTGMLLAVDLATVSSFDELAEWPGRLLIAIDYAETRPDIVSRLLLAFAGRPSRPPVRIVLVVRQAGDGDELRRLFNPRAVEELTDLLRAAELVRLDGERHEIDRAELFTAAHDAFAEQLQLAVASCRAPLLRASHFERPLFVLVAAILSAHDDAVDVDAVSVEQLLGRLLSEHEANYWRGWDERLALGLHADDHRCAVALATLLGAESEQEALTVAGLVPVLGDASNERHRAVARWLSHLYSSGLDQHPAIRPLEPDLLAEVLVASVLGERPQLLGAALDNASDEQLTRALLVLSRLPGASRGAVVEAASAALDLRLPTLVDRARTSAAGGLATSLRLAVAALQPRAGSAAACAVLEDRDPGLLALQTEIGALAVDWLREALVNDQAARVPLAGTLHNYSLVLRDSGRGDDALGAMEEALKHRRAQAPDSPEGISEHAISLNNLSNRLAEAGRFEEALATIEEAVGHRADLERHGFRAQLATVLHTRAVRLNEAERHVEALAAIREALAYVRPLIELDRATYLPDLAESLGNLSNVLSDIGPSDDALPVIEEVVGCYRELVAEHPGRYVSKLAGSLMNEANRLAEAGRYDNALSASREAVAHYRSLSTDTPDLHTAGLALALNNHSSRLGEVGLHDEAVVAIREAVEHYRTLAEASPKRHRPELARALSRLAEHLATAGSNDDALAASHETLAHRRALAADDPARHAGELASELCRRSLQLASSGNHEAALESSQESVAQFKALMAVDPERHRDGFASALAIHAPHLRRVGRSDDALAAIQQAVELRRRMAATNPRRHLPDLAASLEGLSTSLSAMNRQHDAISAAEEAVKLQRTLAAGAPVLHGADLTRSLRMLARRLGEANHTEKAIAAAEESVECDRTLAAEDPARHLPDLVDSLGVLVVYLSAAGRSSDSLAAMQERVDHERRLTADDPIRRLPGLAQSLGVLSIALRDAGHDDAVREAFGHDLATSGDDRWARGVLLLVRSRAFLAAQELAAAISDAWEAISCFGRDELSHRGEARTLLRSLRHGPQSDPAGFDLAWAQAVDRDQPAWLHQFDDDRELVALLANWLSASTVERSQAFAIEHAEVILGEKAETALEHMVDSSTWATRILAHIDLVHTARDTGFEAAYVAWHEEERRIRMNASLREWLTDSSQAILDEHGAELVSDEGEELLRKLTEAHAGAAWLVIRLGLLGLCVTRGTDGAYALLDRLGDDVEPDDVVDHPPRRDMHSRDPLARARVRAVMRADDGEAQLQHALVALDAGFSTEASRVIANYAREAPSWERKARARSLTALTAQRPDIEAELAELRRLLLDPGDR
jgi:tetratricopeptide (TPR) repeat protein